jgi:hypothetical protein
MQIAFDTQRGWNTVKGIENKLIASSEINRYMYIFRNSAYKVRMKHLDHARCSIAVNSTTRDLMKRVARKEQTYDDLINELIIDRNKGPEFKGIET